MDIFPASGINGVVEIDSTQFKVIHTAPATVGAIDIVRLETLGGAPSVLQYVIYNENGDRVLSGDVAVPGHIALAPEYRLYIRKPEGVSAPLRLMAYVERNSTTERGSPPTYPDVITVHKLTDETRNNNSMAGDSELILAVDTDTYYTFDATILWSGNATPDARFAMIRTGLSDADLRYCIAFGVSSASITWNSINNGVGSGETVVKVLRFSGMLKTGTDPGSIQLQWAQITTNAIASTVYAGSSMTLVKL